MNFHGCFISVNWNLSSSQTLFQLVWSVMDITATELFSSRYNLSFYSLLSQDFVKGNDQLISKIHMMTYRCNVLVSSRQHRPEVHAHSRQVPLCLEWGAPVPREFLQWWQFLRAFSLYCGPHAPDWTTFGTQLPCCCSLYETKSIKMVQAGILLR